MTVIRIILVVLGFAWVNLTTPRRGYKVRHAIPYGSHRKQKLDLYRSTEGRTSSPVIVYVHGGGWRAGHRRVHRFVAEAFTSAGYTVAVPDYRLYPEVTFPAFIDDVAMAAAWVLSNVKGNGQIVLIGSSAGAHIAALVTLDRRYLARARAPTGAVAKFVGLCGPYDFLPLTDPRYQPIFPAGTETDSQPINFADGTNPPILLIAGTGDTVVDPANTTCLAARIRDRGGPVDVKMHAGVTHVGTVAALARLVPNKPPIKAEILEFLAR